MGKQMLKLNSLIIMGLALGFAHSQAPDPCADWTGADNTLSTLQNLAEQGCAPAQANLGILYYKGQGVERSPVQAAEWYRRAAQNGSATGQFNLAQLYAQGQGVPLDWTQATTWMEAAAKQGHGPAIPLLPVYQRAQERVQALAKLLEGSLRPILDAYQSSQETPANPESQAFFQKALSEYLGTSPRVELGTWPTDGVEEREIALTTETGSKRVAKEFQVLISPDCSVDRFEIGEGNWYQVQIVPVTKARIKVQSIQSGGATEVKGKLTSLNLSTWNSKTKDRCGTALNRWTTVRIEVQF